MSQQFKAACCCGDIVEPPPPPPPCETCEAVRPFDDGPPAHYTVTLAGWSVSFSAPYFNLDGDVQNFDFTFTIPSETYNYFPNQANTPDGCPWPVPVLTDFSGPNREPFWEDNFVIYLDFDFDEPNTCKHDITWRFNPPFEIEPPDGGQFAEWYLNGPFPFYIRWSKIATNTCTSKPHSGVYQVEFVGYDGFGGGAPDIVPFENGTCTTFDVFGITGEVCITATPITLDVRECG